MIYFEFDKEKAINSMLYICQELGGSYDMYAVLKMLYFAEKKHISTYGRPITGDTIQALPHGPVPLISYNLIKDENSLTSDFELSKNIVSAKRKPNMDVFSDSDIECLNESIIENKSLDFFRLKNKSHDSAYDWAEKNTGINSTIPYEQIALSGGASEDMIDYIRIISENQSCELNGLA